MLSTALAFVKTWRVWFILGAVAAAVLAVLWWRAALIAEGIERGRNQVIAKELRACADDNATLKAGIASQTAAINSWKAEADGAKRAALIAQNEARKSRAAIKPVKPASSCDAAAWQLWEAVQ